MDTNYDAEGRQLYAGGGYVKKPKGFADGGPADSMTPEELTAQLIALDTEAAPVPVEEPRPTDQVQTESQAMLDNLLTTATRTPLRQRASEAFLVTSLRGYRVL